jgi:hypothetical protein
MGIWAKFWEQSKKDWENFGPFHKILILIELLFVPFIILITLDELGLI